MSLVPGKDGAPPQYALIATDLGWIGVAATARGLRCLVLPLPTAAQAEAALRRACPAAAPVAALPGDLAERLRRYAQGEPVDFPDAVDLTEATLFQQRVWAITRTIPRGQTRSYQWLAEQAGSPRGARAVGRAMATNPVPIVIPCHRVVGANGRLCGFGGGLDLKARMLRLESGAAPLLSGSGLGGVGG
ncbi:MAG: methylated-DNA--[protein]-cysteine S-methyltransferase [Chloroflexi bacterium]|nr:methylated-DNA--[protein]-cysteine S-methyltransferase [Chloroflexota bacterium]